MDYLVFIYLLNDISAPPFSLVKDDHLPLQYRQRIRSFQEGLLIGALQSSLLVCDCPVKSVLDIIPAAPLKPNQTLADPQLYPK